MLGIFKREKETPIVPTNEDPRVVWDVIFLNKEMITFIMEQNEKHLTKKQNG